MNLACESGKEIKLIRGNIQKALRGLRFVEDELIAACDEVPIQPPPPPVEPVPLDQVIVRPPGMPRVFSWPVVVDLPITARLQGDMIHIEWPALMLDWPATMRDLGQGRQPYWGNSGLIYRNTSGEWVADATEWMRHVREDRGTSYPYAEKWRHGEPDLSYPIGLFVAGLWRHSGNLPEYRRRTNVTWLTWPGLEPWGR